MVHMPIEMLDELFLCGNYEIATTTGIFRHFQTKAKVEKRTSNEQID